MKKKQIIFTCPEVAKLTGWGRVTVWKWAKDNLEKDGRDYLFGQVDIEEFVKERGMKGEIKEI